MLLELCADDDATNNAHSVLSARRCFDFAQHDILADSVGSDTIRCPRERSDRGNLSLYAEEIVTSGIALFAFDVVMHLQALSI